MVQQRGGRWGALAAVLVLLVLAGQSCVSDYFYNVAIARNDKAFLRSSADLKPTLARGGNTSGAQNSTDIMAGAELLRTKSADGLDLVGYWLPASKAGQPVVMLAHGYSGRARQMAGFARWYRETLDYNVFMPDARGHGDSGGNYIGFGWHERKDWLAWIGVVQDRVGSGSPIVLHGVSMGAATVLMTSGEALPEAVKAVIADCGYTSVEAQLSWQLERMYGIRDQGIVDSTSRLTKERAGYSFKEASALDQVRKSRTPTLIIHGDADSFVPVAMAHELFEACAAPKSLWIVPGAAHGLAWSTDPTGYQTRVIGFLREAGVAVEQKL